MNAAPPIFCNAGPLMALGKLNRLDLLADLYASVQIPEVVYTEVVVDGLARGEADAASVRILASTAVADYQRPRSGSQGVSAACYFGRR